MCALFKRGIAKETLLVELWLEHPSPEGCTIRIGHLVLANEWRVDALGLFSPYDVLKVLPATA